MGRINNDWDGLLKDEFQKEYYLELEASLRAEYHKEIIYPPEDKIFEALRLTAYGDVKVVILGQDPYCNENQAHGLAFSVQKGVRIPPSLQNIYRELADDMGCYIPDNGYLVPWTRQGVLLLNTILTVKAGASNSHRGRGWENFTDRIIELLNERDAPIAFLLWGNQAKGKGKYITNERHLVLEAAHPSPFSAHKGFFGCKHFSKTNGFLRKGGQGEVDWQIPNIDL